MFQRKLPNNELPIRLAKGYVYACSVAKPCSILCETMDYSSPETDIACPWDFPATIMEWVAISFSKGSSRSRNQTHISCTGRWILYPWATWEAHRKGMGNLKIWKLRVRGIFNEKIIRQKSLSLSWVTMTWFGHWFTLKTRESSHKVYLLLKGLETNLKKKMSEMLPHAALFL